MSASAAIPCALTFGQEMIFSGTYYFGKKRVACRNAFCATCGAPRFFEGRRSLVVIHLMFVPLLPIGTKIRYFCESCSNEIDAERPSRPLFLVAGAFFGTVIAFVGVMNLIYGPELGVGIGCIVFGAVFSGGLIWMLRRSEYAAYDTGRASVQPLAGDVCPYCERSLLPSLKPRCYDCRVDILRE